MLGYSGMTAVGSSRKGRTLLNWGLNSDVNPAWPVLIKSGDLGQFNFEASDFYP